MIGRWIWVDGRLSWPLVAMVVFISAFAIAFDFGWRVLVLPFETYLLIAVLLAAAIAIVRLGICVLRRRRTARQTRA